MTNNKELTIQHINDNGPKLIAMLGGRLHDFDIDKKSCTFEFNIGCDFCHSINIVQGGFVTAMLDIAMSHAAIICNTNIINVSSLEIKTSYLAVTKAGPMRVEGCVIKQSYKTAFMEGRIYNKDHELTATASTVAKLIRETQ